MPNRIIRKGILRSGRVNALSPRAELFYRRLMSVVDDFGRYHAEPATLRSDCYPTRPNVPLRLIRAWLDECARAGLVVLYEVAGSKFLEYRDFRQQQRAKTSEFPPMPSTCAADAQQMKSFAHLDVGAVVVVDEGAGAVVDEGATPADEPPATPTKPIKGEPPGFLRWWDAYPRKSTDGRVLRTSRKKCLDKWKSAHLEDDAGAILDCLVQSKGSKSWLKDGGKWIWNSLRFLNEEPWTDPGYLEDIGGGSAEKIQQRAEAKAQREQHAAAEAQAEKRRRAEIDAKWNSLAEDQQKAYCRQVTEGSLGKFIRTPKDLISAAKGLMIKENP